MESQLVSVSISKTCFYQGFNFLLSYSSQICTWGSYAISAEVTSEQFLNIWGVGGWEQTAKMG